MTREPHPNALPILVALAAVGCLSVMDVFMKSAALAAGAYSAALARSVMGTMLAAPLWVGRGGARWPQPRVLRMHVLRGVLSAFMGLTFFYAITILPLAETIAISFFAPIVSLYLAAVFLHERIQPQAVWGAIMGFAGTLVIVAGRLATAERGEDYLWGLGAIIVSTLIYAVNLVIARVQSQMAPPLEIATFHSAMGMVTFGLVAPFWFVMPGPDALADIAFAAVLTVAGAALIGWAYARAEAQVLVPLEYSAFLWASALGWLVFAEVLTVPVLAGAALIVVGCVIATRRAPERPEPGAL